MNRLFTVCIVLSLLFAGCERDNAEYFDSRGTVSSDVQATEVPVLTYTPRPALAATPTSMPQAIATSTPIRHATATPTATVVPTAVLPAPTNTAQPAPTSTNEPAPEPEQEPDPLAGMVPVAVSRVIDGDTIAVMVGGREHSVRIIGVDTPETVHPSQPVQCFGAEATAFTTQMVERAGWQVYLERDVSDVDVFGRLLRYVWLAHDDGLRMLNQELVSQGYAQVSTYQPDVKYADIFVAAQRVAVEEGRGLWGACGGFGIELAPPTATPIPAPAPPLQPAQSTSVEFIGVYGAAPWGTAAVEVRTAPGASCNIGYVTPAGTQSRAQGLFPKTADGNGYVAWSWVIGSNTRSGTGIVTVTCNGEAVWTSITIG